MIALWPIMGFSTLLLVLLYAVEARKRRLKRMSWDALLDGLMPVKTEMLALVGLESRETGLQSSVPLADLWECLGGWRGLLAILANADRLHALAAHAHSWDSQNAEKIAARMRAEGARLERAACGAIFRHFWPHSSLSCGHQVQRIASAYYEMTESLLDLYDCPTGRGYSRLNTLIRPYLSASEYTFVNYVVH